jgi:hypothetical protein
MSHWNEYVVNLLSDVRVNSIYLSEYHRGRFYKFKSVSKYFDLPVLFLSTVSASFSVGATPYISNQNHISLVSCATATVVTILTSIKLYLDLPNTINLELKMSKEFYTLSTEIYKVLSLAPEDRGEDGIQYLNKKYSHYTKLVENSNLLKQRFKEDKLTPTHGELHFGDSSSDDSPQETNETNVEVVSNI